MNIIKNYSELISIPNFIERFEYLKLDGIVGAPTFGSKRDLNQLLYKTERWRRFRDSIILRDDGCDLGISGRQISGRVLVHHIIPITIDDVLNERQMIYDPENVITVSHMTHEAIHYGDSNLLMKDPITRIPNDTIPWRNKIRGGINNDRL